VHKTADQAVGLWRLVAGMEILTLRGQVWPLFVLAIGLPGWAGYRFGRPWPVLEPRPTCEDEVPRDRTDCAGCAAQFPRPLLEGTEVFA
jgi:hypothetical protein